MRCQQLSVQYVESESKIASQRLDESYRAFSDNVAAIESRFAALSNKQLEQLLTYSATFPSDPISGGQFAEKMQDLSRRLELTPEQLVGYFGLSMGDLAFLGTAGSYQREGAGRREALRENYRRTFEFYFWSDHGPSHYRDVLAAYGRISEHLPPSLIRSHEQLLVKEATPLLWESWQSRITDAIRLHDSEVFTSRASHPELAFKSAMSTYYFLPLKERALRGVIAMLHSKTAVPTALLGEWLTVLREGHPESTIDRTIFDSPEIQDALAALEQLSPSDNALVVKAAELIRIADANRSLGPNSYARDGVTNSIGRKFSLDAQGNPTIAIQRGGDLRLFPVIPAQRAIAIGNLSIGNPRFYENQGRLIIDFPYFGIGPTGDRGLREFVAKLNSRGLSVASLAAELSTNAGLTLPERATLRTVLDILSEYPPGSLFGKDGSAPLLRLTPGPQ